MKEIVFDLCLIGNQIEFKRTFIEPNTNNIKFQNYFIIFYFKRARHQVKLHILSNKKIGSSSIDVKLLTNQAQMSFPRIGSVQFDFEPYNHNHNLLH